MDAGAKRRGRGPGKPRKKVLRTVDIVRWIYKACPAQFTVNMIADEYGIARGEAYRRIQYMLIYQLARRLGDLEAHRAGRREVAYGLTRWGRKYAAEKRRS